MQSKTHPENKGNASTCRTPRKHAGRFLNKEKEYSRKRSYILLPGRNANEGKHYSVCSPPWLLPLLEHTKKKYTLLPEGHKVQLAFTLKEQGRA